MSPRTLRRKLLAEGTSFHEIHTAVRQQAAIELLQDPDLSLEDIAHRLGFSDSANFRHAFKKWTGRTTSEYRR